MRYDEFHQKSCAAYLRHSQPPPLRPVQSFWKMDRGSHKYYLDDSFISTMPHTRPRK